MEPHDAAYWHALSRAIAEGGGLDLVVLATSDGKAIAAVTCHLFGEQAIYWSGASLEEALVKRANPLCLHAAISLCRRLGVRRFELGRFAAAQDEKSDSITHYKAQFGGAVHRLPNVHLRPPDHSGALRRMGRGLFARLAAEPAVARVLARVRRATSRDGA